MAQWLRRLTSEACVVETSVSFSRVATDLRGWCLSLWCVLMLARPNGYARWQCLVTLHGGTVSGYDLAHSQHGGDPWLYIGGILFLGGCNAQCALEVGST